MHACLGTAFTREEREKLNLRGLLPHIVETIEQQAARCLHQLRTQVGRAALQPPLRRVQLCVPAPTDDRVCVCSSPPSLTALVGRAQDSSIAKHIYVEVLRHRNETLFFYMLTKNFEEMAPIVYTPTGRIVRAQRVQTRRHARF